MNTQVYHLVTLVIAVAALLTLILTGHDGNGSITAVLNSVLGGVVGGSAGVVVGNIVGGGNASTSTTQQGMQK